VIPDPRKRSTAAAGRDWGGPPTPNADPTNDESPLLEHLVDTFVRDLFRAALQLQGIRSRVDDDVRDEIDEVTENLDRLIATTRRVVLDIVSDRRVDP
jgi:hypothetical protein